MKKNSKFEIKENSGNKKVSKLENLLLKGMPNNPFIIKSVTDESVIHANEKKIKSTNKNDLIIKNSLNIKELFLNKSNSNVKKESDIKIYSKYIKNIVKYDPDDITPLTSLKTFGPYLKKIYFLNINMVNIQVKEEEII